MTTPIYTQVKNPQWQNVENTIINCEVFFTEFNQFLPFTATPTDPMPYGVEIYNDCVAGLYGEVKPYIVPVPTAEQNKSTAVSLLQATDWATRGSVSDPAISNPYLTNQDAFFAYQNTVRQYAINPVAGNITWPTLPQEVWTTV